MSGPPTHYRITLSEEHLAVLTRSADLAARISMGQLEDIVDAADPRLRVEWSARTRAKELLREVRRILMPTMPEDADGWSIDAMEMDDDARVNWDFARVAMHRRAWDVPLGDGWSAVYAEPRRTKQPLPRDEPRRTSYQLPLVTIEAVKRPIRRQMTEGTDT